jgi:hypothetical protein
VEHTLAIMKAKEVEQKLEEVKPASNLDAMSKNADLLSAAVIPKAKANELPAIEVTNEKVATPAPIVEPTPPAQPPIATV